MSPLLNFIMKRGRVNMYFVVNVLELISFCIFLLFIVGFGLWYLYLNLSDYINNIKHTKKQKKQIEINKEKATEIIDKFEDLLAINDIKIPNKEREGNEEEACIYGSDYYNLEESIIEILNR